MLDRRQVLVGIVVGASTATFGPANSAASQFGAYQGRVRADWLADNANMRLVETFEYIDPDKIRWPVPAGTVVNGASIPRFCGH